MSTRGFSRAARGLALAAFALGAMFAPAKTAAAADTSTVTVKVMQGQEAYGKVSGGKTAKVGSSITLTATANKGYAFVGWYRAGDETTATSFGGAPVSYAASWKYTVEAQDPAFVAKFVAARDDWLIIVDRLQGSPYNLSSGDTPLAMVGLEGEKGTYSVPTITVTGLPSGISYVKPGSDNVFGTFRGKAKNPGVYYVTFKATNKNGYEHSLTQMWVVGGATLDDYDQLEDGLFERLEDVGMRTGKHVWIGLKHYVGGLGLFDDPPPYEVTKLTVAGLPQGVKFAGLSDPAWAITGCPTKAGKYTITVSATLSYGGSKVVKKMQKTVIVADSGCRWIDVVVGKQWEGLGTVSKSGVYKVGGNIPLSAKVGQKGAYFGGWYFNEACEYEDRISDYVMEADDVCYTASRDHRKANDTLAFYWQMVEKEQFTVYARFVGAGFADREDEIVFKLEGCMDDEYYENDGTILENWVYLEGDDGDGYIRDEYYVYCLTYPTVTAKNLPPGVSLDTKNKDIVYDLSKVKPGMIYSNVLFTAKNESGHSKTLNVTFYMGNLESDLVTGLEYEEPYGIVVGQDVASTDFGVIWLNGDEYDDSWTVTVSGLPSGIGYVGVKSDSQSPYIQFTGAPTKAGIYVPTITFTRGSGKDKETEVATFTVVVGDMPAELTGVFRGLTCFPAINGTDELDGRRPASRAVTITAKKDGKLSAKVGKQPLSRNLGGGWQLNDDGSWTYVLYSVAAKENGQSVAYRIRIDAMVGAKTFGEPDVTGVIEKVTLDHAGNETASVMVEDGQFYAYRDVLATDETLAPLVTALAKQTTKSVGFKVSEKAGFTPTSDVRDAYKLEPTDVKGSDVKAKVTKKGVVSVGGKVDGSSFSASTTLFPVYDEDENSYTFYGYATTTVGHRSALVYIYFGFWPNADGVHEFTEMGGNIYLE